MQKSVFLPVVALLVAGCADPSPIVAESEDDFDALVAGERSGLAGIVLDEAIRPIADATVTVTNMDLRTQTDLEGRFAFLDLEPGSYFLEVTAYGFLPQMSSATVSGDIERDGIFRIQLSADPAIVPYVDSFHKVGFLECSTSSINACGVFNAASNLLGLGNITADDFAGRIEVDGPGEFIQSEAVWEATQSISEELWLIADTGPLHNDTPQYGGRADVKGPSPIAATHQPDQFQWMRDPGIEYVGLRMFAAGWDPLIWAICTLDPCQGGNPPPGPPGVALQQPYEMFTTITHNFAPPAGWTFVADGAPVPPSSNGKP